MRALLAMLTVDDRVLDEEFKLTPDEAEGQSQDEPSQDVQGAQKKSNASLVQRGKHSLRMKQVLARYGERYVRSANASAADDSAPNDSITGQDTRANEIRLIYGRKEIRPWTLSELRSRAFSRTSPTKKRVWQGSLPRYIQHDLVSNRMILERIFHLPINADIVMRDFRIGGDHVAQAVAVFVDGIADKTIINTHILEPLMLLSGLEDGASSLQLVEWVQKALLPGNQVMKFTTWKEATENILAGSTVLFLDGVNAVLSVETKGWEHRTVGLSQTEAVVRGPHDAFTESFRANTALVRAKLRSSSLITEIKQLGRLASTDVAIMYIDGIANPKAIKEVKRRISSIKVDYLPDSGLVEQFIEDAPMGVIPKFFSTERPDRVAHGLTEGQIAIFVGHSPYVLLVPVLFWSLLHTSEDAYLHWPFGSFIRLIRIASLLIALLLPAMYIAVTNYHPEMIPTDIMLSIASSRERVPFPVVVEVLIMEFSIELIREAGIRIPSVIGPTIGIVGALILGQAAVAAGIISPLLIIVVAVTALGSFTMPNYNLSFTVRVLRFGFIFMAAIFGFYGIVLGLMLLLMHAATLRSLGVPILSPIAPRRSASADTIWRGPAYKMEQRPNPFWPSQRRRQSPISRSWSPEAEDAMHLANEDESGKG